MEYAKPTWTLKLSTPLLELPESNQVCMRATEDWVQSDTDNNNAEQVSVYTGLRPKSMAAPFCPRKDTRVLVFWRKCLAKSRCRWSTGFSVRLQVLVLSRLSSDRVSASGPWSWYSTCGRGKETVSSRTVSTLSVSAGFSTVQAFQLCLLIWPHATHRHRDRHS